MGNNTAANNNGDGKSNDWTIMIYMAGDNNLSEEMAKTLNELSASITQGNSVSSVSFLVYFNSKVAVIPPLYFDITEGTATSTFDTQTFKNFIEQDGNKNVDLSSSGNSIVNFVKWCIEEKGHTAENYALLLSGHSNAFDENTLLRSDNSREVLTIKDLSEALEKIYFIINDGKAATKPLDILGFDSCLMSMLEIGYEFRKQVRYLIGSQGETPNAGWNYGNFLNSFINEQGTKEKDAREMAQDIVKSYIGVQRNFDLGGRSVDIAAWDLGECLPLISKIEVLFKMLRKHLLLDKTDDAGKASVNVTDADFKKIIRQQVQKSILLAHWNCQGYWLDQAIDIKDFCLQLFSDIDFIQLQFRTLPIFGLEQVGKILGEFRDACQGVIDAVDQCVVATGSLGADYQFSNGISLFFPWTLKAFRLMKKPYVNLSFAVDDGNFWLEFLDAYLANTMTRNTRDVVEKIPRPWHIAKNEEILPAGDGDGGGETRGTKTDVKRGSQTDVKRGTLAFLNEFKSFKNYDSDYWEFFKVLPKTDTIQLKFSESIEEYNLKSDR